LTNPTTVTADRNLAGGTTTIGFMIITWKFGVLVSPVQRGTISVNNLATTGNATVSALSTTRTCVSFLGASCDNVGSSGYSYGWMTAKVYLNTSTQIKVDRNTNTNNLLASYEAYEFSSDWVDAVVACKTESVATINVTSLTSAAAVTALNTGNAILIFSGYFVNEALGAIAAVTAYSGEGVVGRVFPKTSSPTTGLETTFHMIVFNKNVVKQRALRLIKHVGGTGEPDTLTLSSNFTAGKSALFWLGTSASLNAVVNEICRFNCIASFAAPNTLSSSRVVDTDDCNQSLELIEFY
jgi:hypothetical protein